MDVRPARDEDVPAVQRVASAAWHAAHADIAGADVVEEFLAEYYTLARLRSDVADESRLFLVADDAGDDVDDTGRAAPGERASARRGVVGFALALPADEEPDVYALGRIYVHPDRWGEGIGSRLLDRVETGVRERGGSRLRLGVMAENRRAVGFYEARGFERVEEGYDDRLDVERYIYAKDL
ncbi:MAG: GNAT family N-acetyltransferase [Haloarculaceae archaeon]